MNQFNYGMVAASGLFCIFEIIGYCLAGIVKLLEVVFSALWLHGGMALSHVLRFMGRFAIRFGERMLYARQPYLPKSQQLVMPPPITP